MTPSGQSRHIAFLATLAACPLQLRKRSNGCLAANRRLVPRTDIRVIVRLRSRLENQASSRVRAYELRRHRSARGFIKSFARTMQRNHVSRIDFLECPDRISNVVLLIGREMKAPDHRMNFFHTRGGLSLLDRVDQAAMAARS